MTTRVTLAGEEQHFGEGDLIRMGDRQKRGTGAQLGEPARRPAVKLQLRGAAVPHHFDVAPEHAARVSGAERLHRRFLCRESAGKMNGRHPAARAVDDLAVGEHASHEPLAVPRERLGDAVDIRDVQAESDEVR